MNPNDAMHALTAILDDDHDAIAYCAARELMIECILDYPEYAACDEITLADFNRIKSLILLINTDRELTTQMLLNFSLCPMHAIDYAICFDDDDAECAAIRLIHPSHDT